MEQVDTGEPEPSFKQNGLHLVNRLSESRSPYVRRHMENPVAWQMWDEKALALAKKHNRLIFLNIGYASCHWCHIMERESFSAPEVVKLLNDNFIPIKIDREERPDIDTIYMNYVQAISGTGGHPLNIFITPDLEPLFGGTYWPGPNTSMTAAGTAVADLVGFLAVLEKMKTVWKEQEHNSRLEAKKIMKQLRDFAEDGVHSEDAQSGLIDENSGLEIELFEEAYLHIEQHYDEIHGGFSSPPKFPTPGRLSFLLNLSKWPSPIRDIVGHDECKKAHSMARTTLFKMARGGIRDQIGSGFARASVTDDWSLPHFEKMLYDQAQLLSVYLEAYLIMREEELLGIVRNLSEYLVSGRLSAPDGGFFSSEDADSLPDRKSTEKSEGAFYVWTYKELLWLLGPRDTEIVARVYGISPDGNVAPENDPHDDFINQNVLHVVTPPSVLAQNLSLSQSTMFSILESAREKMISHREVSRVRPDLDDKIVLSWNGLAISALARTATALYFIEPSTSKRSLDAAIRAVRFIKDELWHEPSKTFYRVWSKGKRGSAKGLCEDYAFMITALIDLYEATFEDDLLAFADTLQKIQLERFRDTDNPDASGFYTTPLPHPPDLLLRLKSGMDNAEPSSNSVSASNLFRLGTMLCDDSYLLAAKQTLLAFEPELVEHPFLFTGMLGSVVMARLGVQIVVLTGDVVDERALTKLRCRLRPDQVVVRIGGGKGTWLKERSAFLREMDPKRKSVIVCYRGTCEEGGIETLDPPLRYNTPGSENPD